MSNIAVILAGGVGKRMNGQNFPKQFIKLKEKPIIIHTIENILNSDLFSSTYIVIHPDWTNFLIDLLKEYKISLDKIKIVSGGKERIDSIENALNSLKKDNIQENDIVVIHDAVRPFIKKEFLQRTIQETGKYGATVAVVPVKDTMIISENNIATDMPDRSKIFYGQAPDSFKFKIIYDALKSLTEEEKKVLTGTAQICQFKNIVVHTYLGDEDNIKITTPFDLKLAELILEKGSK